MSVFHLNLIICINQTICFVCLQLQSASVHFIAAKHTTPIKNYVEDINFRLVSYHFFTCCRVSVGLHSSKNSWND